MRSTPFDLHAPAQRRPDRLAGPTAFERLVRGLRLDRATVGVDFGPGSAGSDCDGAEPTETETVLVAVTRGVIDRGRRGAFSRELRAVLAKMTACPGLVGFAARQQILGRAVWTLSAWTDAEALRAFVQSQTHRRAAKHGGIPATAVEAAFVELPRSVLPLGWDQAERILAEHRRRVAGLTPTVREE